jgi:hypothetical protein
MTQLKLVSLFICLLFFFAACKENTAPADIAFYHWKANINIGTEEMKYLDDLAVKKLYLRFFDVHWDQESKTAIPISQLQWKYFDLGRNLEIVPVIYITNITLEKNEYDIGTDSLAKNIAEKLRAMILKMDSVRFTVKEIQIDCDWSLETQAKFFRLLEQLRRYMPEIKTLSATIRLHQIKYFTTTGVPPVDRGVLMFYNMGAVIKPTEKNSILNLQTAKEYLENFDIYPLSLDVALPLFSWAVQFREDKIIQLINDVSEADFIKNENFQSLGDNKFKVLKSSYLKGIYIYKNDIIRLESVKSEDLTESIKILKKAFGKKRFNLIFYHLDDYIVKCFNPETLKKLANY